MNNYELVSKKKNILSKLAQRQLKDAFLELMQLAVNVQDWQVSEKLSELETNYKYMLHYQFEGTEDTQRESVYSGIQRALYELTDDILDELLLIESPNTFYERLRINRLTERVSLAKFHDQLKNLLETISIIQLSSNSGELMRLRDISVKRERVAIDMFLSVFTSPRANEEDNQQALNFINSNEIAMKDKCLFISAFTLNLFQRFDYRKAMVLMEACMHESNMISQRAIVGLIILLQMYDERWQHYVECKHRLDSLFEKDEFRKSVRIIIKQLIQSRETEKISKKLTEEIIPEMMKMSSLAGKKLNMDDLMGETDLSDKNPEWKKELEESGLADKLQEYSSLQMEGADVFHSTFSHLKSFPFFREMSNWFLPFDTSYSELLDLSPDREKSNLLYSAVLSSGHMCDSDKYSFSLSLLQIPASQRDMMIERFGAESEELKQIQKDAQALNPRADDEIISNQYIQNLYRFFKLNPNKNSFFDVFTLKLDFYDKKSIAPLISDEDSMRVIAHYCFNKNYFSEALNIYEKLSLQYAENSEIFQKIGYCKQMLHELEGALAAYLHADLILPNNSWTIKRIAQIYRSLKQPQLSLEFYQKAAQLTPNNMSLEMNIGHCYLELKEYDKALNSYYKIELLDTKGKKAWRPIAWTSFLLRKFETSQQYYKQILEDKPTVHDFLNAGHVSLCLGDMKDAISHYKQAIRKEGGDMDLFVMLYEEDKDELIEAGIKEDFFPLVFDQLRYELD